MRLVFGCNRGFDRFGESRWMMGSVCCNIAYLVALMNFYDQQDTGNNNATVQRELGPVSQSKLNLICLSLGHLASVSQTILENLHHKASY